MWEMENLSPYNLIKNLKEELRRGKKDCQSEAIDLFKKIFKAIDFHTDFPSFTKGLNDLELKFSNMEAKAGGVVGDNKFGNALLPLNCNCCPRLAPEAAIWGGRP